MPPSHAPHTQDRSGGAASSAALELKGSVFTLTVIRLHTLDLSVVAAGLRERLAQAPRFFRHAPVVLDLQELKDHGSIDFPALLTLLRGETLVPVGVRRATPEQTEAAVAAGLAALQGGTIQDLGGVEAPRPEPKRIEPKAVAPDPARDTTNAATRVVRQPVRSGQRIYARGGDLVVLAPVNAGAEIMADGHIHVYAPLRGRALAGVNGDTQARIFAQCLEPELVAIAGHYRVFEEPGGHDAYGKVAQVHLDGEQLIVAPLS